MQTPRCEDYDRLSCRECAREFFGQECFTNHKNPKSFNRNASVCQKIRMCKICFVTISSRRGTKSNKHICGASYCAVCKKNRFFGHFCFMPVIKEQPTLIDGTEFLFIFFDFETMQKKMFEDNQAEKVHQPNLWIAHQACQFCISLDNIFEDCAFCGRREHIFYGNYVISSFVEYLLGKENFKKVVVMSHYGSAFDNQFILKYLVDMPTYREKPKIILTGSKIVLMTFLNLKFIDTLFSSAVISSTKVLRIRWDRKRLVSRVSRMFSNESRR